jgi:hypothetical protein
MEGCGFSASGVLVCIAINFARYLIVRKPLRLDMFLPIRWLGHKVDNPLNFKEIKWIYKRITE